VRSEAWFFAVLAAFMLGAGAVYYWWTDATQGGPEWAGTLFLLLSGVLCVMCGGYFAFVSRRINRRPEDRADSDVAEGAGEVGFFSPASYWPLGLGLSAATAALGVVLWQAWMVGLGVVLVLAATGGMLFEYYTGTRG
jgi:hypothetical protein